jgi:hypothetical protein
MLSGVERDEFPNHKKQLEHVQGFTSKWSAGFSMDDEREKSRIKEARSKWMASLVSSLNLGSEEMTMKEYICAIGKRGNF